jgi:magnesium chelatase family protein
MAGPSDTGAVMLAERLPGLLPDLDPTTAAEVAATHRAAGTLPPHAIVRERPPWQAPHHSISRLALTGTPRRPGIAGLAHGGVLFCDNAEQLSSPARNALCAMVDHPHITLVGAGVSASYPARVQLLLASHGCPTSTCGGDCQCPPAEHRRTRNHMARLLDRVDIHAALPPMPTATGQPTGESTAVAAARVATARATAAARWGGQPWATNAEATTDELQAALARVPAHRFAPLQDLIRAGAMSQRGAVHVLKIAFTIADLANHSLPTAADVAEAIRLRTGQQT